MNVTTTNKLVSSSFNPICFDDDAIDKARKRFLELQEEGIIKEKCTFADEVWYTTDEYSNVGLHFTFNRFSYNPYGAMLGLTFEHFLLYVKAFLISIFGKNALASIHTVLLDLRHIISTKIDDIYGTSEEIRIALPALCSDFLAMLPSAADQEAFDRLLNAMDQYAEINMSTQEKRQRSLADFDSYFKFDEIIKEFWKSEMSKEERLFYCPLYLWWVITGVVPLRPREFLLTERNCLSQDKDGSYLLRLRRNQLKGGRQNISYKLADDYSVDIFQIPPQLGNEIQQYLDLTEGYGNTEINTLFVTDPHYKKWEQTKHSNSRYLTYMNMNTILKYFYKEVICGQYGLTVLYESADRHLADNEIGYIHLGDTRHIALINLMQEGGTPYLAMLLAGHTNLAMASHYYSNLESLIQCKTYRQYKKYLQGNVQYQISTTSTLPVVGESVPLSDGGRCCSKLYLQGNLDDCRAAVGESGEIAYCPQCPFYRNVNLGYSFDDIYKRNLRHDCNALQKVVELVRQNKGSVEEIGEALLRLQSSSASYAAFLLEKHKNKTEEYYGQKKGH